VTRSRRLLPLVLAAAGCTAALKEPPPLSTLAGGAVAEAPAGALLQEAAEEYAKRPDVAAVRRADALCLEAAQADEADVAGLLCSMRAKAWLVEHAKDAKDRTDLAVSAVHTGQWCLRRVGDSVPCKYWLAVSLGMQAREKPRTADDAIGRIVKLLREAGAADPELDEAGPERILALLLMRAPGWPLGPGDVEEALGLARKAVAIRPNYPPNQLALGEALAKNGDRTKARAAYARALELASAAARSGDPDAPAWGSEASARLRE